VFLLFDIPYLLIPMTNDTPTPTVTTTAPDTKRLTNILIALAAIALSVSLFFALRTPNNTASLAAQAAAAQPLDVALTSGKPTLMEFYADWCTSCQAMAGDLATLKKEYKDKINFVMLNVDNNKWLPEMVTYRVDGIPHFVFLDNTGKAIAQSLGEQPRSILTAKLDALIAAQPLPDGNPSGKISVIDTAIETAPIDQPAREKIIEPRTHGS